MVVRSPTTTLNNQPTLQVKPAYHLDRPCPTLHLYRPLSQSGPATTEEQLGIVVKWTLNEQSQCVKHKENERDFSTYGLASVCSTEFHPRNEKSWQLHLTLAIDRPGCVWFLEGSSH